MAFRLTKEGFHQRGQLLDSAQSVDGQPFHLVPGLYEALGNFCITRLLMCLSRIGERANM
ncbi:hypothetical protein WK68_08655 [Burkholderia ubonensis]|nr:hypothetical protein WK68_08655 [Burkholderia ubonensis]